VGLCIDLFESLSKNKNGTPVFRFLFDLVYAVLVFAIFSWDGKPPRITKAAWCQFHQHFMNEFCVPTSFRQLFLVTFWLWQKNHTKNVDEIDTCTYNVKCKPVFNLLGKVTLSEQKTYLVFFLRGRFIKIIIN